MFQGCDLDRHMSSHAHGRIGVQSLPKLAPGAEGGGMMKGIDLNLKRENHGYDFEDQGHDVEPSLRMTHSGSGLTMSGLNVRENESTNPGCETMHGAGRHSGYACATTDPLHIDANSLGHSRQLAGHIAQPTKILEITPQAVDDEKTEVATTSQTGMLLPVRIVSSTLASRPSNSGILIMPHHQSIVSDNKLTEGASNTNQPFCHRGNLTTTSIQQAVVPSDKPVEGASNTNPPSEAFDKVVAHAKVKTLGRPLCSEIGIRVTNPICISPNCNSKPEGLALNTNEIESADNGSVMGEQGIALPFRIEPVHQWPNLKTVTERDMKNHPSNVKTLATKQNSISTPMASTLQKPAEDPTYKQRISAGRSQLTALNMKENSGINNSMLLLCSLFSCSVFL